jgi:hypothetical protein
VTKYEQYRELTGFGEVTGTYGVTVCRGTLNRLDEAFKGFFRRIRSGARAGFPRFKGRGRFRSLSWPDGSGWKLDKSNGEHSGRLYLQGVGVPSGGRLPEDPARRREDLDRLPSGAALGGDRLRRDRAAPAAGGYRPSGGN